MLSRFPLSVSAVWKSKTVTTSPPKLIPHEEWLLEISLAAPHPFRVAAFMCLPECIERGLLPDVPSAVAEIDLHFFPHNWSASDVVRVSFGWREVTVVDPELKANPRASTALTFPPRPTAGRVLPVCQIGRHDITLALMAIARQDTQSRRLGRWRVRPRLAAALPPQLVALTSGRQHGSIQCEIDGEPSAANGLSNR